MGCGETILFVVARISRQGFAGERHLAGALFFARPQSGGGARCAIMAGDFHSRVTP